MKTMAVVLIILCCVSIGRAAVPSVILFSDSFDRADSVDIDASSDGMGGLLSPMTYVEVGDDVIFPQSSGAGNPYPELTQILGNRLYMAYGTNMTTMYLNHNFVDDEILIADGMRIGITIIQDMGPQTGLGFFVGFGVGNTLAECESTWFDQNGIGFRGQPGTTPRSGTSDLWIGWSPVNSGTIQVFKNGPTDAGGTNYDLLTGIALTGNDRLELELYYDDYNDGSPVKACILWNGKVIGTDSFAWDADGLPANYIGINGRQTVGYIVDDLKIDAIFNDRAQDPGPADQTTGIASGTLNLEWNKGKDSSGNPNSAINKHYVYVTRELFEGEPNFVAPGAAFYEVADVPGSVTKQITVASDEVVYWRVDESILVNGTDSGPNDPNTIMGLVWSFETIKSVPIITGQPANALVEAGQTAQFMISVDSASPELYAWYKTPDNANNTPDDDVLVDTSENLVWLSVTPANEGYYYCIVSNDSGVKVPTNVVKLGVKRNVAYWTLDLDDFVGGFYLDVSGNGHHAEPNLLPDTAQFVDGLDPAKTSQALDMTVNPLSAADAGDWAAAAFTNEVTVSAWLKWAGTNGAWQGIVSNRVTPTDGNFYVEIRQDNGNVQFAGPNFNLLQSVNLPVGQWTHLAVTASTAGINIYMNGLPVASRIPAANASIGENIVPMYIGALARPDGFMLASPFNGIMDDIRIYNYVKDRYGIADLYYDITAIPLCLNPANVNMAFDVAGGGVSGDQPDCRVDLQDFAVFAGNWLNCGYYPQEACY
jgi:hypothetical protein